MEEIKFRAWDKLNKMFVYFEVKLGEEVFLEPPIYEKDLYLYTGLKDKNGEEIYEGDILNEENVLIGKVVYEAPMFWAETKKGSHFIPGGTGEVIGNIYENPELLESKT